MPVKFKPSQKKYVRGVAPSKLPTEHFYIKQTPKKELFDYINSRNAKKKIRQQVLQKKKKNYLLWLRLGNEWRRWMLCLLLSE